MKLFRIDDKYTVVCESKSTRSGFKHEATLFKGALTLTKAKAMYYNRTWEQFEFETVIKKVLRAEFGDKANEMIKLIEP
jgi:hypothetical protein